MKRIERAIQAIIYSITASKNILCLSTGPCISYDRVLGTSLDRALAHHLFKETKQVLNGREDYSV